MEVLQLEYLDLEENNEYEKLISRVVEMCFQEENLQDLNLYISVTLTTPEHIRKLNKEYRKIDKETDVLSFPIFEKQEIQNMVLGKLKNPIQESLGDVVISIQRVKEQAVEYGHCFERELAYMVVHGCYHLMGYDHMEEVEKAQMRQKEESVLNKLDIKR